MCSSDRAGLLKLEVFVIHLLFSWHYREPQRIVRVEGSQVKAIRN